MASTRAKALLVAGSIVGGGAAALYAYDYFKKTKPGGGCTSASCFPLICSNGSCVACTTNGQCGVGYVCEFGTCIPASGCTTDANCPNGEFCYNGQCLSCNQLIPYSLKTPSIIGASLFGSASLTPNCGTTVCGNPSCPGSFTIGWNSSQTGVIGQCPSSMANISDMIYYQIPFSVTLVDSAGHGICNQVINTNFDAGAGGPEWQFEQDGWVGSVNATVSAAGSAQPQPPYATTDSNGVASFVLNLVLYINEPLTQQNIQNVSCGFTCSCPSPVNVTIPVTGAIQFTLESNPALPAPTSSVQVATNLCFYVPNPGILSLSLPF